MKEQNEEPEPLEKKRGCDVCNVPDNFKIFGKIFKRRKGMKNKLFDLSADPDRNDDGEERDKQPRTNHKRHQTGYPAPEISR